MAFPTIPTVAAGRVLWTLATSPSGTHTSPNLSSLTKNAGDLLIAGVIIYDGNSTNAEFSAWGGSFTEFADFAGTATMGIGLAYKWSTGSETGTFTVTSADASTNDSAFFLLSIPGAHGSTPPEAGSFVTGTTAAADPGSFDPAGWAAEDTLWIAVGGSGETGTGGTYTGIASAPANYSDFSVSGISADVVGGVEGAVAFRQLNAASEDVGVFSVDTSNARNSALVVAIRPIPTTDAAAENASGTGTAYAVTSTIETNAALASGTGAANQAVPGVSPNAGNSAGTGTAFAVTAMVDVNAGLASGTGAANQPAPSIAPTAGLASGTGSAFNATVDVAGGTNAQAGVAAGTGTAYGASISIAANAGNAVGTGAAYNPSVTAGGAIAWGIWSDVYCNPVSIGAGHGARKPRRLRVAEPATITGTVDVVVATSVIIEGIVNDDEVVLEILAGIL